MSSRFRWKFEIPRFFALYFDFWWVKRNSMLRFSISCVWIIILEFNFSKFIRIGKSQKFPLIKLSNLKVFSKTFNFCSHLVETNRVSLIFFAPSSLIRYLPSVYRIRETSHYSIRSAVFDEILIPLENRIRERQLYFKRQVAEVNFA